MALVMNLELKLVVVKVSTAEQKLVLNGCLDWIETAANDEIQVSDVGLTYYCEDENPARANFKQALGRSYALSWKPCQGDSLNLPDHMYNIYTVKTVLMNQSLVPAKSDSYTTCSYLM
nr:hypothetical protein [Tanacetum cinerariifolium]